MTKYRRALFVLLSAPVFAAGYVGRQHAHVDVLGQGWMPLDATQSAECSTGGGCAAFSAREMRALYIVAMERGAVQCKRRDA